MCDFKLLAYFISFCLIVVHVSQMWLQLWLTTQLGAFSRVRLLSHQLHLQ